MNRMKEYGAFGAADRQSLQGIVLYQMGHGEEDAVKVRQSVEVVRLEVNPQVHEPARTSVNFSINVSINNG